MSDSAQVPVAELTVALTGLQLAMERDPSTMSPTLVAAYLALEHALFTAIGPQRARVRSGAFLPALPPAYAGRQPALLWCHPQTRQLFARWRARQSRTSARGTARPGC